jgi:hypothetical protein
MDERPLWRQWLNRASTFIFTLLAWVPFHTSVTNSFVFWQALFDWDKPELDLLRRVIIGDTMLLSWTGFDIPNPLLCMLLTGAILFDLLQFRGKDETFIQKWPLWAQAMLIAIMILVILLAVFTHQAAPFVYQTF